MPATLFDGMSSGVPWNQLRDAIIQTESQPLERIRQRVSRLQAGTNALQKLSDPIGRIRTALAPLRFESGFGQMGATVGETSTGLVPLSVSAGPAAEAGVYDVEVVETAGRETISSAGFAAPDEALGFEGTLMFGDVEVEVLAGDTLMDVRDRIRNSDAEVSASVIRVDEGDYRLSLKATETGAEGMELDAGALQADFDFTVQVAGRDAHVRIDGVDIIRSGNTINDVLDGVTLELHQAAPGETLELEIGRDLDRLAERMEDFVEAYNELHAFVKDQTTTSEDGSRPALYQSRTTLRAGFSDLRDAFEGGLHEYGLSTDRDGKMSFDRTAFEEQLAADEDGGDARLKALGQSIQDVADRWTSGPDSIIEAARNSRDRQIRSLESQVGRWEHRLERRAEALDRQFAAVERMISQMHAQGDAMFAALGQG